jgi:inner membrane protein
MVDCRLGIRLNFHIRQPELRFLSTFVDKKAMDSITQIVLGGAVGELVAGRKLGNKAILWGAVAGTIPDLDVFFRVFYHPIDAALVHRGFSHSIFFAVLFAPFLAWVFNAFSKNTIGFKTWFHLFFWGIITHPILDMFTNYGTQFFWPLSYRITFNSVFVVDPFYTLPFLVCLVAAMFYHREDIRRRKWNRFGLLYSTSYLMLGLAIKGFVFFSSKRELQTDGIVISRMMVTPMPFTPFYWYVLAEQDTCFTVRYRSLFRNRLDQPHYTIPKGPIRIDSLRWKGESFNGPLKQITDGYVLLEEKGNELIVYDLRFGLLTKFTKGQINRPLMGYTMKKKQGLIVQTEPIQRIQDWKYVAFEAYWKEVFGANSIRIQSPKK